MSRQSVISEACPLSLPNGAKDAPANANRYLQRGTPARLNQGHRDNGLADPGGFCGVSKQRDQSLTCLFSVLVQFSITVIGVGRLS